MGIRWSEEQLRQHLEKRPQETRKPKTATRVSGGRDRGATSLPGAVDAKIRGGARSKYRNVPTVVDGFRFDSKAEAEYYRHIKCRKREGELLPPYFLRQVPFHLPGGVVLRVDFVVFEYNGTVEYVDVKGLITPAAKNKLKQVLDLYHVEVRCVRRGRGGWVDIPWAETIRGCRSD